MKNLVVLSHRIVSLFFAFALTLNIASFNAGNNEAHAGVPEALVKIRDQAKNRAIRAIAFGTAGVALSVGASFVTDPMPANAIKLVGTAVIAAGAYSFGRANGLIGALNEVETGQKDEQDLEAGAQADRPSRVGFIQQVWQKISPRAEQPAEEASSAYSAVN